MLDHEQLAARFQELLKGHREAEKAYAEIVRQVSDPTLQQQIAELLRDKQRHIRLTERLLEIVL